MKSFVCWYPGASLPPAWTASRSPSLPPPTASLCGTSPPSAFRFPPHALSAPSRASSLAFLARVRAGEGLAESDLLVEPSVDVVDLGHEVLRVLVPRCVAAAGLGRVSQPLVAAHHRLDPGDVLAVSLPLPDVGQRGGVGRVLARLRRLLDADGRLV